MWSRPVICPIFSHVKNFSLCFLAIHLEKDNYQHLVSCTASLLRPLLPMCLHSHSLLQSILFWAISFSEPFFLWTSFFSDLSSKFISWNCYSCHLKYVSNCKLHFLIYDPPVHQMPGWNILALVHRKVSAHWLEQQNCTRLITCNDFQVVNARDIWWLLTH